MVLPNSESLPRCDTLGLHCSIEDVSVVLNVLIESSSDNRSGACLRRCPVSILRLQCFLDEVTDNAAAFLLILCRTSFAHDVMHVRLRPTVSSMMLKHV